VLQLDVSSYKMEYDTSTLALMHRLHRENLDASQVVWLANGKVSAKTARFGGGKVGMAR
jgi:hypothetical protein